MSSSSRALLVIASSTAVAALAACSSSDTPTTPDPSSALARAGYDQAGMHRQYGTPVKVGNGMARTYVVLDSKNGETPMELGIALDAKALDQLPNDNDEHSYLIPLPAQSPAPYTFAELDWNPQGHPPVGIYTTPHFDFHFYTISKTEWNSIVPSDPNWATNANNIPPAAQIAPTYFAPIPPFPPGLTYADIAVPHMGVHWLSALSPELQGMLGNPAGYLPFTSTFIYGSWAGRNTFYEPMVTRAYLLSQPSDVVKPIMTPAVYPQSGYFPTAFRVTYDAQAKEYRIALTSLVARN